MKRSVSQKQSSDGNLTHRQLQNCGTHFSACLSMNWQEWSFLQNMLAFDQTCVSVFHAVEAADHPGSTRRQTRSNGSVFREPHGWHRQNAPDEKQGQVSFKFNRHHVHSCDETCQSTHFCHLRQTADCKFTYRRIIRRCFLSATLEMSFFVFGAKD